jgi:general stress protein 26
MSNTRPLAELDSRYSDPDARPAEWSEARTQLEAAEVYWLSTVRRDGRPHVTPLIGVWYDDAFYFCTGPEEQKAKNLSRNAHCIATTGCNTLDDGLDLVVEGDAVIERDEHKLEQIAKAYEAKYGAGWHFEVREGAFHHGPGVAVVYEVAPSAAYGFAKGKQSSHTRWSFDLETA